MFRDKIRILVAALFVFCVVPMAAFAQDGGSLPDFDEQNVQKLSLFAVTADALMNGDPETNQKLLEFGFSSQEIQELTSEAAAADVSVSVLQQDQQQSSFFCPCSVSATSNIIFQTGAGFLTVLHEYTSGLRISVGALTCPAHAFFCIWSASSQRPGHSPSWFVVNHSSYAHMIHRWCS